MTKATLNTRSKPAETQHNPTETHKANKTPKQLTCERCGQKTDGGAWLGFAYIGAECLTLEDREYIE